MRAVIAVVLLAACSVSGSAQSRELKVGDPAPDFTLEATDGRTYRLSSFKGKRPVVVAWLPVAGPLVCTLSNDCSPQLGSYSAIIDKYDVTLFMAIVPPKNMRHPVRDNGFPLLTDPTGKAARAYGVLTPANVSNRWTFYIDKNGKVAFIDKAVRPETLGQDMVARFDALKFPSVPAGDGPQSVELKVGDPAPDFKLKATDGKTYRLSSFTGKKPVVLAWIPRRVSTDGTSLYGCNYGVECGSLTGSSILNYDVAFFMAAVVPSLNGDIVGGRRLNPDLKFGLITGGFPLLRDPTERTATAYGVLTPGIGVTNRWTFYIGNDGTIAFIDKAVGAYTSGWDIVARLDTLRFPRLSAEKIAERLTAEKKAEEIRQEEERRTREWEEECRRRPRWCRDDSGSR